MRKVAFIFAGIVGVALSHAAFAGSPVSSDRQVQTSIATECKNNISTETCCLYNGGSWDPKILPEHCLLH